MLVRVVLVADEAPLRRRVRRLADQAGVLVREARWSREFWQRLGRENADLILVSETALPNPLAEAVAKLRAQPDQPEVVALTDREDPECQAAWISAGCLAVVNTGVSDRALHDALRALVDKRREAAEDRLRLGETSEQFRLGDFVSKSPRMRKFVEITRKVASSDSSILILGETGVGKERLAQAIHAEGERRQGPFVVVNCGAVPESLWESELFGHEEGAFTGAVRARRGYLELAHGGTVFLDEIGDMPLHLQVKLLRVLQERSIQRLGSEQPLSIDVRVMAATNRDLAADVAESRFRTDLFYRLSVITLTIPPLRERREDIPALVEDYVTHFATQLNREIVGVSADALQALVGYDWPGNVRELMNVVERACLLCSRHITLDDLPENVAATQPPADLEDRPAELESSWLALPLARARRAWLDGFERQYLEGLLRETRGRISETAERAGIDPRSLYDKMKRHGLKKEDFKV